jgi:hypothetical protein
MKHRARNSKIKYEHHMICNLREVLERDIEPLGYVESIFPGEIRPIKGRSPKLKLSFKYTTTSGAKLLAYSSSAVQEVFVVTKDAPSLQQKLDSL